MGRLTERHGNTYVPNENANYEPMNCMDKLGRLEDLEEQGRLIAVDKIEKELEQSTTAKYICENGTVISTDVGYVEEWLKEYVKVLKELNK